MKAPNPTFLDRAEKIHSKRKLITLILLASLSLIVLIVVFVVSVAARQKEYAQMYPDLVGKATGTTTTIEITTMSRETSETTETAETSETTETSETPLAPSIHIETTPEETSASGEGTSHNDPSPEVLSLEDFHFSSPRSQVVSHQKRAVMLDKMKNNIESYILKQRNMRVGFRYISLRNGEELGIRELDPIVPAGTFALPISIVLNEKFISGALKPSDIITYEGHSSVSGSYISSNYSSGKQIYLNYLEYLMLSYNDRIALEMTLDKLGGLKNIADRINSISSFQPYNKEVFYTDYSGKDHNGAGRSTCFDMSNYIRSLYNAYTSNPSGYQSIMNALANSNVDSPIASAFAEQTPILHIYGRNTEMNAYTELAIIDAQEPIAVCIYVECADKAKVAETFTTIGGYLSGYIKGCY